MTDFMPEPTGSDALQCPAPADFFESTRPAPFQEYRPPGTPRAERRPAAALASDVHALLDSMAHRRVPRVDALRARVAQLRTGPTTAALEAAMQQLQAGTRALDFLAGRSDERGEDFIRQGEAVVAQCSAFVPVAARFAGRQGEDGPVARLVWIELVLEAGSLQKRVRQAARWLAEMDQDLVARLKGAGSEVAGRAIEELARRGVAMHARLHDAHRLCGHARAVHRLCEQLAGERRALCATLQDKVRPSCVELEEALRPLLHAATYRVLVPTELMGAIDARHELQVVLTQAQAHVERLRAGDRELAAQLAAMQDKARAFA